MPPSPPVARRRRLIALLAVLLGLPVGIVAARVAIPDSDRAGAGAPARLTVAHAGRTLADIPLSDFVRAGRLDRSSLSRAIRDRLPGRGRLRVGAATLDVRYDVAGTTLRAMRAGLRGGRVEPVIDVVASRIEAPVLRQAQRNTCESAALEILLATRGVRVDQAELQAALPRSGPLDPTGEGDTRVWGDPDAGYVGRPDGGGDAGGFGVYPGPIAEVASQRGVRLQELTGQPASAIYRKLREGRAVMVWVGLTDGPYGTWQSPGGRTIQANFGEHTVVLTGIDADGALRVSNPLEGTAETWTPATFELMWERLDRRALAA